jgi:phage repressor protein C with HTH and peptisase S24 domain/DNA-binding Xre family transcriptional regulator
MDMAINARIKKCRLEKGMTLLDVANKIGVQEATMHRYESGRIKNIKHETLVALAKVFNCDPSYLMGWSDVPPLSGQEVATLSTDERALVDQYRRLTQSGRDAALKITGVLASLCKSESDNSEPAETANETPAEYKYLPEPDLPAAAGAGVYLDGSTYEMKRVAVSPLTARANFVLRVAGSSMEPEYSDGDTVLVESCPEVAPGDIGFFVVNNEAVIKQLGEDRLVSLNPEYPDIEIHEHDSVRCFGRVLGKL